MGEGQELPDPDEAMAEVFPAEAASGLGLLYKDKGRSIVKNGVKGDSGWREQPGPYKEAPNSGEAGEQEAGGVVGGRGSTAEGKGRGSERLCL